MRAGLVVSALFLIAAEGRADWPGWPVEGMPEVVTPHAQAFRESLSRHRAEELDITVAYFQELTEWALTLRAQTLRFSREARTRQQAGEPLRGDQLDLLRVGMNQHLALRDEVRQLVAQYEPWFERGPDPFLAEEVRLKGIMLGVAGALLLYDNFALSMLHVQQDEDLRRLVNRPDSGFNLREGELLRVLEEYHSPSNRRRVRSALEFVRSKRRLVRRESRGDPDLAYLDALISQSPSAQDIAEDSAWKPYARTLGLFSTRGRDRVDSTSRAGMGLVSRLFGNTVGLVKTRRGRLYAKPRERARIEAQLEPLDILLEKTPFRLTDKLIPGHFGHVAVWLGKPEELHELGVWSDPVVRESWMELRQGARVLEALRDGVQLNTLEKFLDVDDLIVLRFEGLDEDERRAAVVRALRQKGKDYDFNFDVQTTDRIVCSELAYLTFTHVEWPTDAVLSRATISPDNVATLARPGGPLRIVTFYRDGRRVRGNAAAKLEPLLAAGDF
ncbi:MAG: Poxvirus G6 [Proteobacteria bacterium]|nr:Poxvirus G6 [Pseudomonadota bacterium]